MILVLGLVGWGLSPSRATRRGSRIGPEPEGIAGDHDPYIGSQACRECHPGAYAAFLGSGHARTFDLAGRAPVARQLDGQSIDDPELPGVRWTFERGAAGDQLSLVRHEGNVSRRMPLDFAFGSGRHAMTFVTLESEKPLRSLEHRITFFAALDRLGITPGQRTADGDPREMRDGRELHEEGTLRCFRCHVTRTSADSTSKLDRETLIPRISCERCHGPGRAHVDRMAFASDDPDYRRGLDHLDAAGEMHFCGQCHRHPDHAPPGRILRDNPEIARFQPVGLMQSRCYQESAGAMRCVSCHDPHSRGRTDAAHYEAICLSCHNAQPQAVCSVSPREGCIGCHMSRVDSGQEITFSDHWIRVRTPEDAPRPENHASEQPHGG
jgi:hypothetical protein